MKIAIKNMVCPRCITAVQQLLQDAGLKVVEVNLGEAVIEEELMTNELSNIGDKLKDRGFELLNDTKQQLVDKIKSIVINQIHHLDNNTIIFSDLLSKELHKDYSSLSKLFSVEEGVTLEQFIILQKIEKVKELLLYKEKTLSEIATMLGYSSTAHLSTQFKKTTGLTPTVFKQKGEGLRKSLDDITKNI
ncbi:MAG: AraC family transcriptional regulator [Flavobacterium sp. MedPE-SWcel]|uniref:helix-turn-helix domain-containing protein n=1 Tax=uncultured Flavobacterium sp. TaxID=165435 RepID=UPI0009217E21|nr:AraC family transcriptional regulator [uncultured Flavobacterium sp.]OIQ16934.1 MAG: AraC family transcriptional regulator [Flavobacterium sp. MedPE-SWcel]